MRPVTALRDLVAEYDKPEPFDSSMDAADLLEGFVLAAREIIAEDDFQRGPAGDQAWTILEFPDGRIGLDHEDGRAQLFWDADVDPFSVEDGESQAYHVLRAIYGGNPGPEGR